MGPKNKKLLFIASFEDASILRKFTILFLVASIIPMVLLYYIYVQNNQHGHIGIASINFTVAMVLMVLGVLVGFMSMRSLLQKVINISKENSAALGNLLSPDTIKELNQGENEIVILSRSFSAVTQQLEENVRSLELAKKTLHAVMSKVGQGISNMENIDTFLELIVETMTNALNGKVGTLLLLNEKKTELTLHAVHGANYDVKKRLHLKFSENSPLFRVIKDKRPAIISGIFLQNTHEPQLSQFFGDTLLCVPLIYHDRVSGVMTLSKPESTDENALKEDLELVFNLASQTAVAIENSKLNSDIEKTYFETISALALAVDAKDEYSRGHLDRVSQYALMIGRGLGLDDEDLNTLRDAARLHDLGKIGVPDEILKKQTHLSDEEWVIMRRHPQIGESIIKPIRSLQHLCDPIRHHHEKMDGTGYPDGLKGEEISPLVRILCVADVWDSLTTERSYRAKKSKAEAISVIRSMKAHLDQDIVDILLEELK
ncbi:MAG: HD domain-containing protein [Candidatus Omnitrophica bacterium]|nr:HD domain-containing protein [Candidatus Omnitrophota bacterium]